MTVKLGNLTEGSLTLLYLHEFTQPFHMNWYLVTLPGLELYIFGAKFFNFQRNARLKLAKNQADAKRHPEAELLFFKKLFTVFI